MAVGLNIKENNCSIPDEKSLNADNELLKRPIKDELTMIKMKGKRTNIITESKLEEMAVLRTSFEEAKKTQKI